MKDAYLDTNGFGDSAPGPILLTFQPPKVDRGHSKRGVVEVAADVLN